MLNDNFNELNIAEAKPISNGIQNSLINDIFGAGLFDSPAPVEILNQNNLLDDDIFGFTKPATVAAVSVSSNDIFLKSSNNNNEQLNGDNSFIIYEKNSIKIKFSLDRKDGINTFIMMSATNTNSLLQISGFKFEASVPKTFQVSYVSGLNSNAISPNSSLNQLIQVTNPKKVSLLKIVRGDPYENKKK